VLDHVAGFGAGGAHSHEGSTLDLFHNIAGKVGYENGTRAVNTRPLGVAVSKNLLPVSRAP